MSRLVVVDDEPLVLDAIRRQLRPGQQGWDARFFRDPAEALAFMDEHPTDVVLTDLNMASMSGEAFLQGIQARSPGTVRLLLTGDSRMRTSLPAVLLAHQSFSKPCDPLELRHAIERALRTRRLFGADRLGGLAGAPETLPSVPQVYAELTRTMNDPDAGLADVAEVIDLTEVTDLTEVIDVTAEVDPYMKFQDSLTMDDPLALTPVSATAAEVVDVAAEVATGALLLPTATLGALIRLVLRLCGRERWVQFGPPPGAAKANSTA